MFMVNKEILEEMARNNNIIDLDKLDEYGLHTLECALEKIMISIMSRVQNSKTPATKENCGSYCIGPSNNPIHEPNKNMNVYKGGRII